MSYVKDFKWKKGMNVDDFVSGISSVGFQSVELGMAVDTIIKMKETGAKIFFTFTSNMVTSGLRGFFSQIIRLKMADIIVTTVGGIEEDIMRAFGEKFIIGDFGADDVALYEEGVNRVGNIFVTNKSYEKFEEIIKGMLNKLYQKQKSWTVSEMLREIGLMMDDEDSILYQAARNDVPIFCPAITDGAFGFHLFMFQQKNPDFMVDVVKDFSNILFSTSIDDKKGIICLGGGVSKHHAIFSCLINGGLDYAVYMTTSTQYSGSMSGATTNEAKSWGKIKDNSDAVTVIGDVSITFPLVMIKSLEELSKKGIIKAD
jgi:deoxyhypusine synthase